MSRIQKVIRELNDLRDFQLKLERRHETASARQEKASAAEVPVNDIARKVQADKEGRVGFRSD